LGGLPFAGSFTDPSAATGWLQIGQRHSLTLCPQFGQCAFFKIAPLVFLHLDWQ